MAIYFEIRRLFCPRCGRKGYLRVLPEFGPRAAKCESCLTRMTIELIQPCARPEAVLPSPSETKEDQHVEE